MCSAAPSTGLAWSSRTTPCTKYFPMENDSGELTLVIRPRKQLQEAEARREILAHRARQDSRGFSRGYVRVRPALEVVRVHLKSLTDSAPRVQVCSLRAAPRGIGSKQPGAEIIAPNMEVAGELVYRGGLHGTARRHRLQNIFVSGSDAHEFERLVEHLQVPLIHFRTHGADDSDAAKHVAR